MAVKINVSEQEQQKAVKYIAQTFEQYKQLLSDYQSRMLAIYKEYSSFTQPKLADWKTTFKVNKAHEVVNKILPRIMSKNPKWLVSNKPDIVDDVQKLGTPEEKQKKLETLDMHTTVVRDYLTNVFDKYNLIEPSRLWAKNMIIYGNALAKIKFKYEIARSLDNNDETEMVTDPETGETTEVKNPKKITEYVW
jgi:hypothetical protein